MGNSWGRREDETDASWTAFRRFRDMTAPRRITPIKGLYSRERCMGWAKQYNWFERAADHDRYIDDLIRYEYETVLKKDAQKIAAEYRMIAHEAKELVARELRKYLEASEDGETFGLMKPAEIKQIADLSVNLERLYTNQPTEIIQQDYSKLSDEELLRLKELMDKLEK